MLTVWALFDDAAASYCGKAIGIGKLFFDMSIGFVLPKGSPLTAALTEAALSLKQTNELKTLDRLPGSGCAFDSESSPTITLRHMLLFFCIGYAMLLFFLGLSFVLIYRARRRNNKVHKEKIEYGPDEC